MGTTALERPTLTADVPLEVTGRRPGWRGAARSVRDIWAYRELLGLLVHRELRAKYKDSALGFVWSLIKPLTMLLVYYVAIGKFLGAEQVPGRSGGIPGFAIFIFSGLTLWTLFSEIVAGGTGSIVGNGALVKKIYLPREVFPLSVVGSSLVNFAFQLAILVAATQLLGPPFVWDRVGYAVLALLLCVVTALWLSLALSAVNVFLRDIQYLVEVALMVLMWASPIVYAWSFVDSNVSTPWIKEIYLANPVTLGVLGFQRTFWMQGADQPFPSHLAERLSISLGISLVLLVVAQRLFARLEGDFAQEL